MPSSVSAEPVVDLWLAMLDDFPVHERSCLASDEIARAERFVIPLAASRYAAARAILRQILASYADCHPAEVRLRQTASGKPVWDDRRLPPLHFNLSHSGDHALFAISPDSEVGVDLERREQDFLPLELAQTVCSPREIEDLTGYAGPEQRDAFYRLWTRKESCLKCLGIGLQIEPNSFEVPLTEDAEVAVRGNGWSCFVRTFEIGECYMATVAVSGRGFAMKSPMWWPSRMPVPDFRWNSSVRQRVSAIPQ
jgi:4'-phosphopantetheinyl transferase